MTLNLPTRTTLRTEERDRLSLVTLRISDIGLLAALHLPEETRIAAAGTERPGPYTSYATLVLSLDMPGAPEGAVTVEPEFTHSGHRDPVELTRLKWLDADGSEIDAPGGPAA